MRLSFILILLLAAVAYGGSLGEWEIDDYITFTCNTHVSATGAESDADSAPTYRIYEDETATPIVTGTMALLDAANTDGFYSERVQLTSGSGFEEGKHYTVRINATVSSITGSTIRNFKVIPGDIAAIKAKTDNLPADPASETNVNANETKIDTADTVVDGIKAVTDNLPNSGALTDIDTGVNNIEGKLPSKAYLFGSTDSDGGIDSTEAAIINAEVDTALSDYDSPTKAEMDSVHSTTDGLITTVDGVVDGIATQVGTAGAGLTDLGGMSTGMKAEVNTEADTALADYDPPTDTEMDAGHSTIVTHLTDIKGTGFVKDTHSLTDISTTTTAFVLQTTATSATHTKDRLTLAAGSTTAQAYQYTIVTIKDDTDGHYESRVCTDWTIGRVMTLNMPLTFTPVNGDDVYITFGAYYKPTTEFITRTIKRQ